MRSRRGPKPTLPFAGGAEVVEAVVLDGARIGARVARAIVDTGAKVDEDVSGGDEIAVTR